MLDPPLEEMDSDDTGFEPDNDIEDYEEGLDENIEEENDETAEDKIAPAIPPSPSKQHIFRWREKRYPNNTWEFHNASTGQLGSKIPC